MTPRQFCTGGQYDAAKGAVHGAMLVGALGCAAYNLTAYWYRREPHNGVNALVYLGLSYLEACHIKHHWQSFETGDLSKITPEVEGRWTHLPDYEPAPPVELNPWYVG